MERTGSPWFYSAQYAAFRLVFFVISEILNLADIVLRDDGLVQRIGLEGEWSSKEAFLRMDLGWVKGLWSDVRKHQF